MKKRIYYDDTDAGGIVYHTNYIKYCEQARSEIFFEKGIFFENDGYVVKELKAKFIKPAKLGDIITVHTKLLKLTNASVVLLQSVCKNENPLFNMEITLVYMKNGKIAKIPQKHKEIINELIQ